MRDIQNVPTFFPYLRATFHPLAGWNSEKEAAKRKRHGISFAEAVAAFEDERAMFIFADAHSEDEERFRLIGRLRGQLVALVIFMDLGRHTRIFPPDWQTNMRYKSRKPRSLRH